MAEFFSFLKVFALCGTFFFVAMLVLLAMPQSRLRSVGMELAKWVMVAGLLLMVPSPIDVLPDVVPGVGWLDDIGYILGAICAANSAMEERKRRRAFEEIEFNEAIARKRGEVPPSDPEAVEDERKEAA